MEHRRLDLFYNVIDLLGSIMSVIVIISSLIFGSSAATLAAAASSPAADSAAAASPAESSDDTAEAASSPAADAAAGSDAVVGFLSCMAFSLTGLVVLYRESYFRKSLLVPRFSTNLYCAKITTIGVFALAIIGILVGSSPPSAQYFLLGRIEWLWLLATAIVLCMGMRIVAQGHYIMILRQEISGPKGCASKIRDYITPALEKLNRGSR